MLAFDDLLTGANLNGSFPRSTLAPNPMVEARGSENDLYLVLFASSSGGT